MSSLDHQPLTVLVTGATTGLGKAIASTGVGDEESLRR
jgi:NADP-dependent 3-hydroxy acid dehydrogenase YdfG